MLFKTVSEKSKLLLQVRSRETVRIVIFLATGYRVLNQSCLWDTFHGGLCGNPEEFELDQTRAYEVGSSFLVCFTFCNTSDALK